jgi:DNA polymerase-3 subunit alpha
MGIPILAPDVNRSGLKFQPETIERASLDPTARVLFNADRVAGLVASSEGEDEGAEPIEPASREVPTHIVGIRYGLAAIKGVGEMAMETAIAERESAGPFTSLENFCARVDTRKVNKKSLENLVRCGAFDWTGIERAELFADIDQALAAAASSHKDRASGQVGLFDMLEAASPAPAAKRAGPAVTPWTKAEKLAIEKELLGFYVTGHPLDEYRPLLEGGKFVPIANLPEQEDKATVTIAGAFTVVEKRFSKKGNKPFAIVSIEDLTGNLEVMIWSSAYDKSVALLEQGNVVSITGRLDQREEGPRLSADEVKAMKKPETKEKPVVLTLDRQKATEQDLFTIRDIISQSPGKRRVEFRFKGENGRTTRVVPSDDFRIALSAETKAKLSQWL